jgi:hypothetical protein
LILEAGNLGEFQPFSLIPHQSIIFTYRKMKKLLAVFLFLLVSMLMVSSCEKLVLPDETPACVNSKIREIKDEEVRNPPAEIWKWEVDGGTYYYITSYCCDAFSELYDDKCNLLCAPDGGITGGGDGRCPSWTSQPEKTLVWKDPR